ncbi:hypothetical protein LINPERPRIM_LOCUS39404, partial [Linum perenne]
QPLCIGRGSGVYFHLFLCTGDKWGEGEHIRIFRFFFVAKTLLITIHMKKMNLGGTGTLQSHFHISAGHLLCLTSYIDPLDFLSS